MLAISVTRRLFSLRLSDPELCFLCLVLVISLVPFIWTTRCPVLEPAGTRQHGLHFLHVVLLVTLLQRCWLPLLLQHGQHRPHL